MMMFLATVSASDEIDKSLFVAAFGCFGVSGLLALIAAGLVLFAPSKSRLGERLSLIGALLGVVAVGFAGYMHQIGFVPVAGDGTPVRAPLWMTLLVPCAPFLANLLLMIAHRRQLRGPQD